MTSLTVVFDRLIDPNIEEEPQQLLQPIAGYEDEPLVSLEKACVPLRGIINEELDRNILIAKANSKNPADGLSVDESASIQLYTMEWVNANNSIYAILNHTLRKADRNLLKPWFSFLKLFFTGVFKLP